MEAEDTMTLQEKFIEKLSQVLSGVDYDRLDASCNGKDHTYAKEVLKQMHDAFLSVYGRNYLCDGEFEFVELPAVICGRNSGHTALGIVTIDLQSSGEHWRTFFLTPKGVLEQGKESLTEDQKSYIREKFIPYDYWYTPEVERDIHVDYDNIPERAEELLEACIPEQTEQDRDDRNMNL